MDRVENLLHTYGLEPKVENTDEIRKLLLEELEIHNLEDHEYLKTLCIQLFAIGMVSDTLLIWNAKEKDFDTHCYIDIQLLCGAGVEPTLKYLKEKSSSEAIKELNYIIECEDDFVNFNKKEILDAYKKYYGIK